MTASWTAWLKLCGKREALKDSLTVAGSGKRERHVAGKCTRGARHAGKRRRGGPDRRRDGPAGALAGPRRGARANLRGSVPARPPEAVALDGGRGGARRAHHVLGRDPRRA